MRKLILWNLLSLDGFFEGAASWALDWHQYAWDDELKRFSMEQLRSAGMLLFGRVTYEGIVFGSAGLSRTLIEHGLFDEYRLAIVPVVLGSGNPLFGRNLSRLPLKLLEARPFSSGCVILRYEPLPAA
jgi:dihydrofolate reductase